MRDHRGPVAAGVDLHSPSVTPQRNGQHEKFKGIGFFVDTIALLLKIRQERMSLQDKS